MLLLFRRREPLVCSPRQRPARRKPSEDKRCGESACLPRWTGKAVLARRPATREPRIAGRRAAPSLLLVVLSRTHLGLRVVVTALERDPVGLDILAAGQIVGPGVARNGPR